MSPSQRFWAWQSTFIGKRDLSSPDGRPLYAYRTTETEFEDLEKLLVTWLGKFQELAPLGDFMSKVQKLASLFVLYASEWWRRRYNGAAWTWEPILTSLGADFTGWSTSQRGECVRQGIEDWRLPLRNSGALRYLGTIALQGGLPMRLLAEAKGGLGRLLHAVLRETSKTSFHTVAELETWVRNLDHYLPRTYRQAGIHVLLAQVVQAVLEIRLEAKLTQSTGAIEFLDKYMPTWHMRFPLPIENADAQGLIEQLFHDAAAVKTKSYSGLFCVERSIELDKDQNWVLRSTVDLPDKISATELSRILGSSELPRQLQLSITAGTHEASLEIRRIVGQEHFRVERRPWTVVQKSAAEEHLLRFSVLDGRTWSIPAPHGGALHGDLPWTFEGQGEHLRLLREGSGSVRANEVLVALPHGWTAAGPTILRTEAGSMPAQQRQVQRIHGELSVGGPENLSCRIKLGSADATVESYCWKGSRLWEGFNAADIAFAGPPQLQVFDEAGLVRLVAAPTAWRSLGSRTYAHCMPLGPVEARYPASGEVKFRSRLVVLPSKAIMTVEVIDSDQGRFLFQDWGISHADLVAAPEVQMRMEKHGSLVTLHFAMRRSCSPPEYLDLELRWPSTPNPLLFRLPFPARGARIHDRFGKELGFDSVISLGALTGVRIRAWNGAESQASKMALEFHLAGTPYISRIVVRASGTSLHTEIRLQDYAEKIKQLLAASDRPEASVTVSFLLASHALARLQVTRYPYRLTREEFAVLLDRQALGSISLDELSQVEVKAMRLDAPSQDADSLIPRLSQGVVTGVWEFSPATREPGPWLIYPSTSSSLDFCPYLWHTGAPQQGATLRSALSMPEGAEQTAELDKVICSLTHDFQSTGWADIEQLVGQIGHLSLPTLSIWRRFARSPAAMASLALRLNSIPASFIDRFAIEFPFAWEVVPFVAWQNAIVQVKLQCESWYETLHQSILKSHLDSRILHLTSRSPALRNPLGCARANALNETIAEARLFRSLGQKWIANRLFDEPECPLQQLLRSSASDDINVQEWPMRLNDYVLNARMNNSLSYFMHSGDFAHRDGVINIPLLIATQTVLGQTSDWFTKPGMVRDLRDYLAFNPDWFDEAYSWTIARCVAAKLLKVGIE